MAMKAWSLQLSNITLDCIPLYIIFQIDTLMDSDSHRYVNNKPINWTATNYVSYYMSCYKAYLKIGLKWKIQMLFYRSNVTFREYSRFSPTKG